MAQKRNVDNSDDGYDCDTESLSNFVSLMKTLFTVYQAQKAIQAMGKIFRVFDSGVKLIQVLTLLADLVLLVIWS
ncbi:hypothetical protein TNCV_774961 [Trichonephila clavipes]|nr:hypothetical protein TNCV_774961 [Trichonephila clavipes]